MVEFLSLLILALVTILALGAAALLQWLLLRAALGLAQPASIRPAAAGRLAARPELARGTMQLARAYAARRQ
jgi:hypothetical protein